jgi:hypothetical protein
MKRKQVITCTKKRLLSTAVQLEIKKSTIQHLVSRSTPTFLSIVLSAWVCPCSTPLRLISIAACITGALHYLTVLRQQKSAPLGADSVSAWTNNPIFSKLTPGGTLFTSIDDKRFVFHKLASVTGHKSDSGMICLLFK